MKTATAAKFVPASRGGWGSAILGAVVLVVCSTTPALADAPPNCTGADFARVSSDVAASMSGYLFAHPDVNDFITSLESAPRDQSTVKLADYLNAHPQVKAEVGAIRQPLADFDVRCGYTGQSRGAIV